MSDADSINEMTLIQIVYNNREKFFDLIRKNRLGYRVSGKWGNDVQITITFPVEWIAELMKETPLL